MILPSTLFVLPRLLANLLARRFAWHPFGRVETFELGDKGVGKTCLVLRFIEGHFNVRQQSTIGAFFLTKRIATQEGHSAKIQIWDTAGQEDYDRLRPLSYSSTDVFLVCYSVNEPTSFQNVEKKWLSELRDYAPDVPIVLVATKNDLRGDPSSVAELATRAQRMVSSSEGADFAVRSQVSAFAECSAVTLEGVRGVFDTAVRVANKHRAAEVAARRRDARRRFRGVRMCSVM